MAENYTRREFLKMGALGAVATIESLGLGTSAGFLLKLIQRSLETRRAPLVQGPEIAAKIAEATTFREKLGLTGVPLDLVDYDPQLAITYWQEHHQDKLVNGLPERLKTQAEEILKSHLGPKIPPVIRELAAGPNSSGFATELERRTVYLHLSELESRQNLKNTLLHEGVGHGTDPTDLPYPPEIFFEIEAAKWQVLSEADNVPGQFLRHPSDGVHRTIALSFAESLHYPLKDGLVKDIITEESRRGDRDAYLKIWSRVFPLFKEKKIPEMQDWYNFRMEKEIGEIYAEMLRLSITSQPEVAANRNIAAGAKRILTAVQNANILY